MSDSDNLQHVHSPDGIDKLESTFSRQLTPSHGKVARAWRRLSEEERNWIKVNLTSNVPLFKRNINFEDLSDACMKTLYALSSTGVGFTASEVAFMLTMRWKHNIDFATVRARMAELANDKDIRMYDEMRYIASEQGVKRLERFAQELIRKSRAYDHRKHAHRKGPRRPRLDSRPSRSTGLLSGRAPSHSVDRRRRR